MRYFEPNSSSSLTGMTKLSGANNAGIRNTDRCTLILTEGGSIKALAVAGLGVVGRDNSGVLMHLPPTRVCRVLCSSFLRRGPIPRSVQ